MEQWAAAVLHQKSSDPTHYPKIQLLCSDLLPSEQQHATRFSKQSPPLSGHLYGAAVTVTTTRLKVSDQIQRVYKEQQCGSCVQPTVGPSQ